MTHSAQSETEEKTQEQAETIVEEQQTEVAEPEKAEATDTDNTETQEEQVEPEEVSELSLKAKLIEAEAKLAAAEKKAQDNWEALVRQKAEYENLQKRTERDVENARKFALEKFVNELLPIRDNLEMGIEAASKPNMQVNTVIEGMNLTDKAFINVLNKFGIVEINPHEQKFDPDWHEAMAMQPIPDMEDNTVVIVHRKGYHLNERLLRPAQVVVAKQA
ncbi:nucleotide exchange factor GrpE [Candidatus Albibeggiatoa sp. nov. BB20]|uniref:nucleotide exchange factor GrpE n=1 Tax=Candidatus Albibeggiatoa sp. nov. BB20 TaxID=3162723 RepID=UPI00336544A4